MASWWVEYARPAANYLEDNGSLVAKLFFAIEALAESEGLANDATLIEPGLYRFEPENHQVVYERDESRQIVYVLIIKPK
jgi:plasmid stabilization system protein ParE